jgi:predicted dienelactone hydrolase
MLTASSSEAKYLGTKEIEFVIPGSDRLVVAEIYYPTVNGTTSKNIAHGIWERRAYTKDAPLAPQRESYPLVIFSHGWRGDRYGNSWIAEALVDEGYIVAMIDHSHNNSYEHSDEFMYTSVWQRPLDLSALLDYLFQHPTWARFIDKNRIAIGGFSLGGLTALWTAGIEGDADAFKEAMQPYARWSDWPQSVKKRASEVDWTKASRSYYDSRVKAVFAISPDLGRGFKPAGLEKARVPVLLIVGDHDSITPSAANAGFYHSHIKNSKLWIIKKAGHYTFLNSCSSLGLKITPHLCKNDSPSRFETHKEAAAKIITFLKDKLGSVHLSKT